MPGVVEPVAGQKTEWGKRSGDKASQAPGSMEEEPARGRRSEETTVVTGRGGKSKAEAGERVGS